MMLKNPTAKLEHLFKPTSLSGGLAYFEYEYQLAETIVIPWLEKRIRLEDLAVGDFGCHQGGILQAFRERTGVSSGTGIDLNAESIQKSPFQPDNQFTLTVGNILDLDPTRFSFDLILIRDVLEHIPDFTQALRQAKSCLKPGGHLFLSFPPYYSPFGGHQQLAENWPKSVPYVHYLPEALFFNLLQLENNAYMTAEDSREDLNAIRKTRLTLGKAEAAFKHCGFRIGASEYYLLRPEFKLRYGVPPLSFNLLGKIPFFREFLVMGAYYLLQNPPPVKSRRRGHTSSRETEKILAERR